MLDTSSIGDFPRTGSLMISSHEQSSARVNIISDLGHIELNFCMILRKNFYGWAKKIFKSGEKS